tara:strand:+ start:887 stop:1141 length:255 start_codon:yes stop_codon:yes gene_type:complete
MGISCALCEEEYTVFSSVCVECRRIKHIMNIYSKKKVLEVIERVLVRNEEHIEKTIIKEQNAEIENNETDNSYVKTRSKKKETH